MKPLKQSTAAVISFGPFVAPGDGVTLVTSLVSALDAATTGIKISKNGGALADRSATITATTYDAYGNYLVTLNTTDTNTLGRLRVQFTAAGTNMPVWDDFVVLPASVYDGIIAGGTTIPAATLASTTNITGGTITTTTNLTNLPSIPANWLTAAGTAADFGTEITDAIEAAFGAGPYTSSVGPVDVNLDGVIMAQGTIGSTGNDTTHVHLAGLTYGDDELNNHLLVIEDVSAGEQHARWITDWADTGDLATVATLPFTPENAIDLFWVLSMRQDVTGGSSLDAAGVRAAVGLATANLDTQLSGIQSDTDNIQTRIPAALVSGRIDASVGAMATGVLTDTAIAADAITAAKVAADAGTEIGAAVWASTPRTLTANTNLNDPTAAAIADAVWDEVLSGHTTPTTTGAALDAAGSAGDPWSTALPGAYGAGTAGFIVSAINTQASLIPASPAAVGSAMTLADGAITPAKIADAAITDAKIAVPTEATGFPSTILTMIRAIVNSILSKNDWDKTAGTLTRYKSNGTTVATTQNVTTDDNNDTIGVAS